MIDAGTSPSEQSSACTYKHVRVCSLEDPPLPKDGHDIGQVSGTAAQPGQIRNGENIPGLQVVQAFLPSGPGLGGTGGILLKHSHGACSDKCIHLGVQRLPSGTDPGVPSYIAGHVKKPPQ